MSDDLTGIRYPWEEPPAQGEAIEVAKGVLWMRLPLPMQLDQFKVGRAHRAIALVFKEQRLFALPRFAFENRREGFAVKRPGRQVVDFSERRAAAELEQRRQHVDDMNRFVRHAASGNLLRPVRDQWC